MDCNFKAGDIIIGNKQSDNFYMVTNSKMICEIISVNNDDMITVKPIRKSDDVEFSLGSYLVNTEFMVSPIYFIKYISSAYKVELI